MLFLTIVVSIKTVAFCSILISSLLILLLEMVVFYLVKQRLRLALISKIDLEKAIKVAFPEL